MGTLNFRKRKRKLALALKIQNVQSMMKSFTKISNNFQCNLFWTPGLPKGVDKNCLCPCVCPSLEI